MAVGVIWLIAQYPGAMSQTANVSQPRLVFFAGPVGSGKSTLALQLADEQAAQGRRFRLFTYSDDTDQVVIKSQDGVSRAAVPVSAGFSFTDFIDGALSRGEIIDGLICDECQFYSPAQIEELAWLVDHYRLGVFCFGLLTNCATTLWTGSKRLVEVADRIEMMVDRPSCWCGRPGVHTAHVVDGQVVATRPAAKIGVPDGVRFQVLCREHHRLGQLGPN